MKILLLCLFIPLISNAGTKFSATLIKNNTYLSIQLIDDHLIPPFEAGELWKILKGRDQVKYIYEKELSLSCEGLSNQLGDVFGKCKLVFPYNLFKKIDSKMVFRADGIIADKLNRYFQDSAYLSMQGNSVYLSSYNTRGLFFFGLEEKLIQK